MARVGPQRHRGGGGEFFFIYHEILLLSCSDSVHRNSICNVTKIVHRKYFKYIVMYLTSLLLDLFMFVCINEVSFIIESLSMVQKILVGQVLFIIGHPQ